MSDFNPHNFQRRHIGPDDNEIQSMLSTIGLSSLEQLISETIPKPIRSSNALEIPVALSEANYLTHVKTIGEKNVLYHNFQGQGYYGTHTPSVILRNIFHNPGWYTQYTPYQAEISQGRMEALLNFQTVVSDLTGLPIANASLLDEGTAAAEAMSLFYHLKNKRRKDQPANKLFVDQYTFQQTIDVVSLRAEPLGIEVVVGDWKTIEFDEHYFGVLLQFPNQQGTVEDYSEFTRKCNEQNIYITVAADLLSLVLMKPPGEWGADACVGTTQRFGIPMGFGGPHAAYFATREDFKRQIPGRIIGLSIDTNGNPAYRMALQTREQHIKREKATSNICTAQALLATMAGMYAVFHGPEGLQFIAKEIRKKAIDLKSKLESLGINTVSGEIFDTVFIEADDAQKSSLKIIAETHQCNFYYGTRGIGISIDETTQSNDIETVVAVFKKAFSVIESASNGIGIDYKIDETLGRSSNFLTNSVFSSYRTETEMMRYIKRLENKDLSLMHSMIPLGSCTMKLNAATQLFPVSYEGFANLHPFTPIDQAEGYVEIFNNLEKYLAEITGFTACSLQPNSGAQGEYAGLMVIREYHKSRNESHRNIALIPSSAHGTNPASAVMAGMKVVVVKCDDEGNIDLTDLSEKAEHHMDNLSSLMITYPSTHGVFEESIQHICSKIHDCGGLVYMDGANMNAQVGLTSPGIIGADVCHLNLHKTFAIPHGGGGPGMGPICVNDKLAAFLPTHFSIKDPNSKSIKSVSAAPWGSASILLISYGYIRLLGAKGLKKSTEVAIVSANYIKDRLKNDYDVLYLGKNGRTAHELIIDLRPYKAIGVTAEDVAKRLMDYGFHAPTLSFPVAGTIMIEPTESESKSELDRFCETMLLIKGEINEIASGDMDAQSNTLSNAPHTMKTICSNEWNYSYSREKAAFPLGFDQQQNKFWPSVARVDNAHGDRNLICTCPDIEEYA